MKKVKLYNKSGKSEKEISLPEELFGREIKEDVVHRAIVAHQKNARVAIAHTKTRKEVRGGGTKPWKQKGTGRARHGSIRSPIWKGGGVTFGPSKNQNFSVKINKKEKNQALLMTLSAKANDTEVVVLDELKIAEGKTKELATLIKKLPVKDNSVLIITDSADKNIYRASANIPKTTVIGAKSLNVFDVMKHKYLLFPEGALKIMKETYGTK